MRGSGLGEREDRVDHRLRARCDQVVGAPRSRPGRPIVEPSDRQLLPPEPVQRRRRVRAAGSRRRRRPGRRARAASSERFQVASPTVSTTTSAPPPVASLTAATTSPVSWLTVTSAPSSAALRQLLVAGGGDDHVRAQRLGDPERRRRDAAADPPDEHPLALAEARARDEHPVRGLVDERERGRLLERDAVAERADVRRRDRRQLGVDALRVLADHVDRAVARARAPG